MKIGFKWQIIASLLLVIAGFAVSLWLGKDLWYNLAWTLTGLLFFIHPVYPENVLRGEEKTLKTAVRAAALILMFVGLTNGFGL